jgi:protein-S-isoprenylcysteine O-methyltransferase Ste14
VGKFEAPKAFFASRGLLIMTQNEFLKPPEQDEAREHFLVHSALPLHLPVYSLESLRYWLHGLSRVMLLDILERSTLMLVFGHFAFVMLTAPAGASSILGPILLVSESLPVLLILTRRPSKALSKRTGDWLLGLGGTILPLLAVPAGSGGLVSTEFCGAIMLIGLYVQISAKVILGRSFGLIAANRGIKVAGPYRIVRHPMYAGYTIIHIGFLLGFPSFWNILLYSTELVIQLARLLREELLLNEDQNYRAYAARVRYRVIPLIF